MSTCPKCNKQLEEGTKYCDTCGAQIFETIFCPNCGEQTSSEFAFCQKCGAAITEEAESPVDASKVTKGKRRFLQGIPKKLLMFGGIGIIALVIAVVAVFKLSDGGSKDSYGLYLKDGEIVYTDYSENGAFEITSRLVNGETISSSELAGERALLGSFIAFSDDGKRIFYPDRIEDNSNGITLYCRDINKPEKEPIKIDSEVTKYAINGDGTKVVYEKGAEGVLYIHDLTEKKKIASGVLFFAVSEDFSKIGYQDDENNFYIWYADKEAVKVASNVSSMQYMSPDFSTIYYVKDGGLYKQVEGNEEAEKIASDVSRVISILNSGEVYYTKAESTEVTLMDYVEDDMASSDADVTKPESPDYPEAPDYPYWRWDYDSDEEYEAAKAQYEIDYEEYQTICDQMREEYNTAYAAYEAKHDRDILRENLQDQKTESTEYTLYYYNGSEETVITDALVDEWEVTYVRTKPVMVISVYNQSDIQKVKLSEISSYDEVSDLVDAALYSSSEKYVVVGSTMSILEQTDAKNIRLSSDGNIIYYLDDVSESGVGDIYKATISDGQVGKPEMYDSDVSNSDVTITEDDSLVYYKNVDNEAYKGDLFINGQEIDYDVALWNITFWDDAVLYYTDWNAEKSYGTLKMYKDGTNTKIADDVSDVEITNNDDIVYLYDYSVKYYTGTLYLYNSGKPKKIDDDVVAIIAISDSAIRGGYYYGE